MTFDTLAPCGPYFLIFCIQETYIVIEKSFDTWIIKYQYIQLNEPLVCMQVKVRSFSKSLNEA